MLLLFITSGFRHFLECWATFYSSSTELYPFHISWILNNVGTKGIGEQPVGNMW